MSESTNEMKFSEKAQLFLTNLTQKVQSNIYISAITEGMMGAMGVLIGGSIVNLLVNLPIPGWADVLRSIGIYDLLNDSATSFKPVIAKGKSIVVVDPENDLSKTYCYKNDKHNKEQADLNIQLTIFFHRVSHTSVLR